ncbi:hypothetical protein J5N97_029692 [Dioscorea zingiberensis]|uniref:Uncharacterized protein n=1 Tax=Dioscorea zingiberensis TaxID=325984 RepID=A0A9D5H3G2_9LILI|nr:hypothetical protein J5N97_029692 [Dioscorea zingiberensis]
MGCAASRLQNEDAVRRCKERRGLMKEAVAARHHLAAAHSDYLRSLRLTGSSLSRFASGEPLPVASHTPHVLLPSARSPSSTVPSSLPPPPPPAPPSEPRRFSSQRFSPSPSPTIASSKLPHILSETSPGSTPSRKPSSARFASRLPPFPNSSYATTPSQASSTWDWENFYPPSPPDSEFFDRRNREREEREREEREQEERNRQQDHDREREAHHHFPRDDDEDDKEEQEEVHCSEWGENYATTECSSSGSEEREERESRSERIGVARSEYGGSSRAAPSEFESVLAGKAGAGARSEGGGSSSSALETRIVMRHHDLAEIAAALEEYFIKAADAGIAVSGLLETGREQLDSSFRQLKKTVYHSNSVLSALSSSWSSKPPLAIKYRLDTGALVESGGGKSHGSTLERLLAWEKKLYGEVKAREGVKIEHEKKLSSLQSQEYRGKDDTKLDKTKASIKRLQSLILVTSEAVATTSSAITKVRDDELAPQLVEICYGLLNMWRCMNQFHEVQSSIVQQVRGLVDRPSASGLTSDLHRLATKELESAVCAWHSSFNRLIRHQREYIHALFGWLKLTLFDVSSDNPQKDASSAVACELSAFCDEWKQALDRLPDTVASEAIKSFINVVHVIYTKQTEELKIKKRVETYSKELDKKSTSLRSIEKKYYQSSMVGLGLPDGGQHNNANGHVFDTRDPLAEKKMEIAACRRKVEDEMIRHAKAVEVTRSMTLNNIQTGLPGVFQAMTGFSGLFTEALQGVCRRAGSPN